MQSYNTVSIQYMVDKKKRSYWKPKESKAALLNESKVNNFVKVQTDFQHFALPPPY